MDHSAYIASKLDAPDPENIEFLLKRSHPGIVVVVESDSIYQKGWEVLERELDAKLTFVEIYRSEHGDSISSISGFLPKKSDAESIVLRKHKLLNAFTCVPVPTIQKLHGPMLPVEYDNSLYEMSVTSTPNEAILFLRPSPRIETKKKYQLRFDGMGPLKIELDSVTL